MMVHGWKTRHTHLDRRKRRVLGVLDAQLLVLEIGLGRGTDLRERERGQ
jgi:hypothetical protein